MQDLIDLMAASVPFNQHLGLELVAGGDGTGVVRLPDEPHLRNHVDTQHAAALFAAAEAASGRAMLSVLAERLAELVPVARSASITYRRPARGAITATATIADPPSVLAELAATGRVSFEVAVALRDEHDDLVAEVSVEWVVRPAA